MKTKIPPHRIEGAFLGLALGDAYGRTLEFVSGEAVKQNAVLIDSNTFMWSEETHISLYIADAVLQMPQSKFDANQFGHLVGSYMTTWLDDPLMPSTNPGNTDRFKYRRSLCTFTIKLLSLKSRLWNVCDST